MVEATRHRGDALVVVVPCFNAGPRLAPVLDSLGEAASRVVLVDDGSTDGAARAEKDREGLHYVRLEPNRGKGHALLAGMEAALAWPETQWICLLDADGQHDPREVPRLLRAITDTGADMVIGARSFEDTQAPWASRFGNKATAFLTGLLLGTHLPDTQSGFRVFTRAFAQELARVVRPGRYETEMEIVIHALRTKRRIHSEPIATLYEPGNASSHYRKVADSYRVYARFARCLMQRSRPRKP